MVVLVINEWMNGRMDPSIWFSKLPYEGGSLTVILLSHDMPIIDRRLTFAHCHTYYVRLNETGGETTRRAGWNRGYVLID